MLGLLIYLKYVGVMIIDPILFFWLTFIQKYYPFGQIIDGLDSPINIILIDPNSPFIVVIGKIR
jgi:hypothetical protein